MGRVRSLAGPGDQANRKSFFGAPLGCIIFMHSLPSPPTEKTALSLLWVNEVNDFKPQGKKELRVY